MRELHPREALETFESCLHSEIEHLHSQLAEKDAEIARLQKIEAAAREAHTAWSRYAEDEEEFEILVRLGQALDAGKEKTNG